MNAETLLTVENLSVSFETEAGRVRAVDRLSFEVRHGEVLGLVGESGCGKSVTALSIMRLLPKPSGRIDSGRVLFGGTDLAALPPEAMRSIRGRRIAMIFQEPMTALNPVHTIGRQLDEAYGLHHPEMDRPAVTAASLAMLKEVGIPDPAQRMGQYPHQISGGMRQRVMIAMALACGPDLLIADEPTTALDVTIQAQILELITTMQQQNDMSVMLITHDLGVIAETCQRVCVMYAGTLVESANVATLFDRPAHPYTQGLLDSIVRLGNRRKTKLPTIAGMVPSLAELPPGCRFQNRCPKVMDICRNVAPTLVSVGPEHMASCHAVQEALP
ncbi:ABC transporter ATP-binding protein [Desulfosudis oleivorans]|uniref:Oligopeptide/dipeptide ABC transporter, ATPase subunit n=1 Tax=Desulfosudis oleivorans (strain DSM 6200 / JCM 39069 / Hxd3) TaxID=96561 RepID=A8ZWE3_DESOH|nr:ABC transporter ATP-binding protein [Desulfosudis oleivorans]ABW66751.1 oligopeptide/dipeptide ABC transporter, ATPase subunit [Desulfosudis oleivorans Hxd3]